MSHSRRNIGHIDTGPLPHCSHAVRRRWLQSTMMSHACLPAGDHLVLLAYSRRDISHPDSQPHHVEAGKLPPCKAHRGREKVSPACCLHFRAK